MAQQREKPWLKNKNHIDKTDNAEASKGKKAELMVFDFVDNAPANNETKESPRKKADETTPRDTGMSPRQDAGDKTTPRGPAADDKSPRTEHGSPRKGDNQPAKAAETRSRRAPPRGDGGYEADTDSSDKPGPAARRGSPERAPPGGKPKPSDVSPRPPQQNQRPVRNTFTGKSTLSL